MKVFTSLAILLILWQCPTNTQAFHSPDHLCTKIENNKTLYNIHAFFFLGNKLHLLHGNNFYVAEFRADGKNYQLAMPKEYSVRVVNWVTQEKPFVGSKAYVHRIHLVNVYKDFFAFNMDDHLWLMQDTSVARSKFYTFNIQTFERKNISQQPGMESWIIDNRAIFPSNYVLDKNNTGGYYFIQDPRGIYKYAPVRDALRAIRDSVKANDANVHISFYTFEQQQLFKDHFGDEIPMGVYYDGHMIWMATKQPGVGILELSTNKYTLKSYKDFFDCSHTQLHLFHHVKRKAVWVVPVVVLILVAVFGIPIGVKLSQRKKTQKSHSNSLNSKTTRHLNKVPLRSPGTATKPTATTATTLYSSPPPNRGPADPRKKRTF